jgi:hypothetical protein
MPSPILASDFRIIKRFPILRGARATSSKASVFCEPEARAAFDTSALESKSLTRYSSDFQLNAQSGGIAHVSAPAAADQYRIRSPSRHSFDGMPEQLVYGLFESYKNVRYVIPKSWSPSNPRQVGKFKDDVSNDHPFAVFTQCCLHDHFNSKLCLFPSTRPPGSFTLFVTG